ncbi:MAG: acyl-ACP--UDP-N-acetylglucosamine O-acyltransferase [Phycisphaerae bacterium]
MTRIHPTAIVDPSAQIDPSATVGPYAIVQANAAIGAECVLHAHTFIDVNTSLGARCQVHPNAVLGGPPQDLKFEGAPTYVQIGDDCLIREGVTIHRGTTPGSTTVVGRRCFLMANSHIAHNCRVGDDVKLANGALLAGHVEVGDGAFLSGNTAIHQFCRIGKLAMLGGQLRVTRDIPPFVLLGPNGPTTINVIGLRRAGVSAAERAELRECYRLFYRAALPPAEATERIAALVQTAPGREFLAFLRAPSKRGFAAYRGRSAPVANESDE